MKSQRFIICFSLIFIIVLASCIQSMESTVVSFAETPSPPAHSPTSIGILTLMSTDPAPQIFTPTFIPTLPTEDASAKLLKFLSDNTGCRLPCLWGITPGISVNTEAEAILAPLSSLSELTVFESNGGGVAPRYTEGDLEIYTRVSFLTTPDNSIVNRIAFNAEAHRPIKDGGYENIFDSKFFGDKVSAYILPRVLSEQGTPSSVMIATAGGPLTRGGTGGFAILLLYPDQGILVNYTTQMYLTGNKVRGCPVNAHIEMELYPIGNSISFFEMLKQTDWAVKFSYYKPLEEVTSMSIDEFYQIFHEPTDKCIETPANLWATPEP